MKRRHAITLILAGGSLIIALFVLGARSSVPPRAIVSADARAPASVASTPSVPSDRLDESIEFIAAAKQRHEVLAPEQRVDFLVAFGQTACALLQARDSKGPQALTWAVNTLAAAGEIDHALRLLNEAIAHAYSHHPPMAHSLAARRLELLKGRLAPHEEAAEIERWFDQAAALKLEPQGLRSRAGGLLARYWEVTTGADLRQRLAAADRAINYLDASAGADLHAWFTQEATEALQRAGDDGRADQRMEAFLSRFPDWERGQAAREQLILNHALREAVTQAHPSRLGIGEANRLGEVLDRGLIADPWRRLQAMGWRCVALKEARQPEAANAQASQMLNAMQQLLAQPGALSDELHREAVRAHLGNIVIGYPGRVSDPELRIAAQLYLLHTPDGVNADAARELLAAP